MAWLLFGGCVLDYGRLPEPAYDAIDDQLAAACPEAAWRRYCLSLRREEGYTLWAIDLDSSVTCPLTPFLSVDLSGTYNLVRSDGRLLVTTGAHDQPLLLEPADGGVETLTLADSTYLLTTDGTGFWAQPSDGREPARYYASLDDLRSDSPAILTTGLTLDSRATQAEGVIYTAWHSTDRFEAWSVDGWASLGQRKFDDYDDYVEGMAVIDDDLFIVGYAGGSDAYSSVIAYPTAGGTRTGEWTFGYYRQWDMHGLSCARR